MKSVLAFILIIAMCTVSYADEIIKEFSGKGMHTTRPFTVPNGWEIQWEAMGGLLQVNVNKANGELDGIAANQAGPGKGSSYQPKGGSYYLVMNAMGEWKVRVVKVENSDEQSFGAQMAKRYSECTQNKIHQIKDLENQNLTTAEHKAALDKITRSSCYDEIMK